VSASLQLQKVIDAAKALEIAKTIPDVKMIRDKAKVIADYCKQQKYCKRAVLDAAELQLRAERKLGQLIPDRFPNHRPAKVLQTGTLKEAGISRTQSHRWQKVSNIPEPEFEQYVAVSRESGKSPNASGAILTRSRQTVLEKLQATETRCPSTCSGSYDVVVVDPPWPMERIERDCRENQAKPLDYSVMTLDEIGALSVPAARDCHLWLWTTHRFLPHAFSILARWGFKYVCTFTWHKPGGFQPYGLPQYNSEFVLYGRRGSPVFTSTREFFTCFEAARAEHSAKPQEFYDTVARVTAGRRLDMFNRRVIPGFDRWGKQAQ
jgi:N6-adenosine-specific RNA methylase IME4